MSSNIEEAISSEGETTRAPVEDQPLLALPEIPKSPLDVEFFSSIIGPSSAEEEKLQKRASSVLKLTQENEKLKAELKEMTDRLELAERKRKQLAQRDDLKAVEDNS